MNRTQFYSKEVVNGVNEIDFLHHNLSNFEMKYDPEYFRISAVASARPDLISWKVYGTTKFWWIICVVNNIQNPFVDINVGDILRIPNKMDIYDFYRAYRKR